MKYSLAALAAISSLTQSVTGEYLQAIGEYIQEFDLITSFVLLIII